MSKMSKIVIAHAVIAGMNITKRMQELEVAFDSQLAESVGDLAESLAKIMAATEIIDGGIAAVINILERGDIEGAINGLELIKQGTEQLTSEQESINEALGITSQEAALAALIASILQR